MLHWGATIWAHAGSGRSLLDVGLGQCLGGTPKWPRWSRGGRPNCQGSPWPSSSSHHPLPLQAVAAAGAADFSFAIYLYKYIDMYSLLTYRFSFCRRSSPCSFCAANEYLKTCASLWKAVTPGEERMVGNSGGCPGFHCETKATGDVSSFSLISLVSKMCWTLERGSTLQDKPVLPKD